MKKRFAAFFLILCLIVSGCGQSGELQLERNQLLGVGGIICSWGEAQVFILTQYTAYGRTYGESVWDVTLADGSFESYIRDSLMEYLKTLLLAAYAAGRLGVSLSEAEQREVDLAADALYADLAEAASKFGITKDAVRDAYRHYALAQIFYRQTITDAKLEISDEEARVISLQIIESAEGYGYEQAADLREKLVSDKPVQEALSAFEGVTMRQESVSRGMYSASFEAIAFSLKQDQWSPVISDQGCYYIVRCLSPYLADATAQHKAAMEMEARQESLNRTLKSLARTEQIIYNPDLWENWSMSQYADTPMVDFFEYTGALEK